MFLARSNAMYSYVDSTVNVQGTITANTTWTANNRYVLNDFVGVAAPATLTIEPGTVIYGGNSHATLFIQRGAKIMASGTSRRPIIFTSPQTVGSRNQTDWGSLVLLGAAPINDTTTGAGEAYLEGLPQSPEYRFGGAAANDNSGVVRYVRLEFGGFEIQNNQEINGLSLAGIGMVLGGFGFGYDSSSGQHRLGAQLGVAHAVDYQDVYHDEVALGRLIRSADVVVLPYDSHEQVTSGVLIEAVAAGVPVVATAFPHAVELLTGGPGLVVPHQDPAALAAAIRRVLTEPGLAARLAGRVRPLAADLRWPVVAARYGALAEWLVAPRASVVSAASACFSPTSRWTVPRARTHGSSSTRSTWAA